MSAKEEGQDSQEKKEAGVEKKVEDMEIELCRS
jgi:hypothetical protein